MTPAEMEIELSRLRRELAQANADDEEHRKKVRLLGRSVLGVALIFLAFSLFLYLNNDRIYLAPFLSAIALILLGATVMAFAAPRAAGR
jgi:hypothetical protein